MLIDTGIDEHMKSISAFNCVSISIEEQIKLKTTLDQLKCDIKAEEMLFWGKILGAEKDYYIYYLNLFLLFYFFLFLLF